MAKRRPVLSPDDFGIGDLFEILPDALLIGDVATGRIVLWNRAATALFGYNEDRAVGMLIEDLVAPEFRQRYRSGVAEFAETRRPSQADGTEPLELPAITSDGHRRWIEVRLCGLRRSPAEGEYLLGVVRDVSDRHELEASLEEIVVSSQQRAEALRGFFSTAAHDLKSPLASVSGALDLVALDSDSAETMLPLARRQVTHLVTLVDEILAAATLAAGAEHVDPEAVVLVDAAVEAAPSFADVTLSMSPEVTVWADRDHVRRIVQNLVQNAATHGRPPIVVSAASSADGVVLTVTDTGGGVPSGTEEAIFNPFERAGVGREVPGTGLGLTAVRRLAELNGGSAWYERDGGATVFRVRLPAAPQLPASMTLSD